MSYTKQTWHTGDTITDTKLNHMEDGIESASGGGGSTFVITATYDEQEDTVNLDKTWNEIKTAYDNGSMILIHGSLDIEGALSWYANPVVEIGHNPNGQNYYVLAFNSSMPSDQQPVYTTDNINGYPQIGSTD